MSNDTKLWVWRGAVLLCLIVDLTLLGKMMGEAMKLTDPEASTQITLWATLFFVAIAANIPVYIGYVRARNSRWSSATGYKTQPQVDVETLAAYAKQEQIEKEIAKKQPRSAEKH